MLFVCLFVFLSAGLGLLQKCLSADFIETWCYDWAYINASAGNLGRSGSLFHFSQHCRIAHFRRLLASVTAAHRPLFMKLSEMNDANKGMNPIGLYILGAIRWTPGSGSIHKSGFESLITFCWGNQSCRPKGSRLAPDVGRGMRSQCSIVLCFSDSNHKK